VVSHAAAGQRKLVVAIALIAEALQLHRLEKLHILSSSCFFL